MNNRRPSSVTPRTPGNLFVRTAGRLDNGGWPGRRLQRLRDPVWVHPSIGTPMRPVRRRPPLPRWPTREAVRAAISSFQLTTAAAGVWGGAQCRAMLPVATHGSANGATAIVAAAAEASSAGPETQR